MKKINKHAMSKFSDALAAWKARVKHRIVNEKEPHSEIVMDNPTITTEHIEIFKAACKAGAARKKLKYMEGLQQRNIGCHHLGTLTKRITPTSRMFSTVLCITTNHWVERSGTRR